MAETDHKEDYITKVYCECGNTEYEVRDNRSKEVMLLVCNECGREQEWKLNGHEDSD